MRRPDNDNFKLCFQMCGSSNLYFIAFLCLVTYSRIHFENCNSVQFIALKNERIHKQIGILKDCRAIAWSNYQFHCGCFAGHVTNPTSKIPKFPIALTLSLKICLDRLFQSQEQIFGLTFRCFHTNTAIPWVNQSDHCVTLASHCDFMLAGCLQNFVSLSYRYFYAKLKETKLKISCSSLVIILADDVVQINATIICLPEHRIYGVHIKQFK